MINANHMKKWADIYKFACEVKGGRMQIRPKHIIVTSNWSIREVYPDPQDYEPLERRFKVHHYGDHL